MKTTREALLSLARLHRHGVVASAGAATGSPEAALVGFVMSDDLTLFFDTVKTSRKYTNLSADPRAAFVIGADGDAWTIQVEGLIDEPAGDELAALHARYFEAFPDGPTRLSWPDIVYLRLSPTWVRLSDYREGDAVTELSGEALATFRGERARLLAGC